MRRAPWGAVLVAAGVALACAGCGGGPDRLYALPLDHEPTAADWDQAVAFRTEAGGGRTTRPGGADVDGDAVHKATASCHHGAKTPPVRTELRAFYTVDRVYLQLRWADPTRHAGPVWQWEGAGWRTTGRAQDGLGLLWLAGGPEASCASACHLEDWRLAGRQGFSDYAMAASEAGVLDLWVWKAGWGGPAGAADDGRLTPRGREPDAPGERFVENASRARSGGSGVFGPEDAPLEAPPPDPAAWAPGFVERPAPAGRTEVVGRGRWRDGWWEVVLSRPLRGQDPEDVRFDPGREVLVGVALLDGVARDHNAVSAPVRLELVPAGDLAGREGEKKR